MRDVPTMTRSKAQSLVCEYLAGGPLTLGELELMTELARSTLESAIRLLCAEGTVRYTSVRARGVCGGSGRPARIYQLAGLDGKQKASGQ